MVNHVDSLMAHSGVTCLLRCSQAGSQSNTTGSIDWKQYQQIVSTDMYWSALYSFYYYLVLFVCLLVLASENEAFMDNHLSQLRV